MIVRRRMSGLGIGPAPALSTFDKIMQVTQVGAGLTKDILTLRPPEGTAIAMGPQGLQVVRSGFPAGASMPFASPFGGSSNLLLIGGLALGGILLMSVMGKR
jgi:hypothetical protein